MRDILKILTPALRKAWKAYPYVAAVVEQVNEIPAYSNVPGHAGHVSLNGVRQKDAANKVRSLLAAHGIEIGDNVLNILIEIAVLMLKVAKKKLSEPPLGAGKEEAKEENEKK